MSTWDLLVAGSTLDADGINTSYDHISNLGGGGSGALFGQGEAIAEITDEVLSANIETVLSANLEEDVLEADVVETVLEGDITDEVLSSNIAEEVLTAELKCD